MMPRYFFDLKNHVNEYDDEGTECTDVEDARIKGVRFAASYLYDNPELVWDGKHIRISVRDASGHIVLTIVTMTVEGY